MNFWFTKVGTHKDDFLPGSCQCNGQVGGYKCLSFTQDTGSNVYDLSFNILQVGSEHAKSFGQGILALDVYVPRVVFGFWDGGKNGNGQLLFQVALPVYFTPKGLLREENTGWNQQSCQDA